MLIRGSSPTLGLIIALVSAWSALREAANAQDAAPRGMESELVFPLERWHNHGSCLVECPSGDLFACWYNGSGERNADDVKIEGARKRKGSSSWSPRFSMADTVGFPDTNPCMFIDPQGRLWLLWQAIVANEWHTALPRYKISTSYQDDGPPKWDVNELMLMKQRPDFAEQVRKYIDREMAKLDQAPAERRVAWRQYLQERLRRAEDKYFSRMGWMTRAHPFVLDGRRLIVPLYSDGYSFSLMAITDDWGATWTPSAPIVGPGNIQPSLVERKDGSLVAYMRDNGPPPKRLHMSESRDRGTTWSPVRDSELPNPGSGAEVLKLRSGRWALVFNDTESGRHNLAIALSDDEGKTWKWKRHLESSPAGPDATHAHYPSIIQARDGSLHVSYTYSMRGKNIKTGPNGQPERECIKHAKVSEAWVMQAQK